MTYSRLGARALQRVGQRPRRRGEPAARVPQLPARPGGDRGAAARLREPATAGCARSRRRGSRCLRRRASGRASSTRRISTRSRSTRSPRCGVLIAVALTVAAWRARRASGARGGDGDPGAPALVAVVALFLAVPWLAADSASPSTACRCSARCSRPDAVPRATRRSHPAVHHGHHHGMDGALLSGRRAAALPRGAVASRHRACASHRPLPRADVGYGIANCSRTTRGSSRSSSEAGRRGRFRTCSTRSCRSRGR